MGEDIPLLLHIARKKEEVGIDAGKGGALAGSFRKGRPEEKRIFPRPSREKRKEKNQNTSDAKKREKGKGGSHTARLRIIP